MQTIKRALYFAALVSLFLSHSSFAEKAKIILIIDDLGYDLDTGIQFADLNPNITLSILPFSPHGQQISRYGSNNGNDILLHSPMAPNSPKPIEKSVLHLGMDKLALKTQLRAQLNWLPEAVGVNNHMGSALTRDALAMNWVMQELKLRDLFFVDSRTTAESIAWRMAHNYRVPSWKRDIFLDNTRDEKAITDQLQKLIKKSQDKGFAIGIGHPYPETLAVLTQFFRSLESTQLSLIKPSELTMTQTVVATTLERD
ncbi:hypothetical protein MAH1_00460 [Sessilibacter sp. MAH1]